MNPSRPYMLPLEKREDSANIRAAKQRLDRQMELQRMLGAGDDPIQETPWTVSDADANTPAYQQWAAAVPSIAQEKVISAKFIADILGGTEEEAEAAVGGKYTSIDDMIGTVVRTQAVRNGADPDDPRLEDYVGQQVGAARRVLATGSGTKQHIELARLALGGLQQHTPGGQYALHGGRTEQEAADADAKYGHYADFHLTPEGQQNHKALRAMEFLSAAQHNYDPANTMSQASRAIGTWFTPAARGVQQMLYGDAKPFVSTNENAEPGNVLLDPLIEFQQMNEPGGKFEYATQMLKRSAFPEGGGDYSVYDANDRPKFYTYSMMTGPGKANAYLSASYPLGWAGNWLMNNKQWGTYIGNAIENGIQDANDDNRAAAMIRMNQNRISPRQVPGMTMDESKKAGELMLDHDTDADAYASALLGPGLSRAMGERPTYLSGLASGAANILGDLVSDSTNVAMQALIPMGGAVLSGVKAFASPSAVARNAMIPRLASAGRSAAKSYATGAARQALSMKDDAIEETGENAMFGMSQKGFFDGQDTNHLMKDMPAEQVTYDKVRDAYTDSLVQRREATQALRDKWRKEREAKKKSPAGSRPSMTQMEPNDSTVSYGTY